MCKSLELINQNGEIRVSSRVVALDFEKEHKNIKRDIDKLISSNMSVSKMFYKDSYKDSQNREQEEFLMNRDGFSLLVMGFTGTKALEWKLKYIEAFNKMEQTIKSGGVMSIEDMMIAQLEEQKKIKNRIDVVENKLDNQMTIDHGQQRLIQRAVGKRVFERTSVVSGLEKRYTGEKLPPLNTKEYLKELKEWQKKNGRKFYSAIYRDVKNRFAVASYRDIKTKDFQLAIDYIKSWVEPQELREGGM